MSLIAFRQEVGLILVSLSEICRKVEKKLTKT